MTASSSLRVSVTGRVPGQHRALRHAVARDDPHPAEAPGRAAVGLDERAQEPLDGALLDVNLNGEAIYPVVDELQARGVPLKTEADGRMFPVTDSSQTIVDCLLGAARILSETKDRWDGTVKLMQSILDSYQAGITISRVSGRVSSASVRPA